MEGVIEKKFNSQENFKYEVFTIPENREDIFKYSKAVVEYLRSEKIPNIVLIDRSARPLYVGVKEYWHSKYPNEKIPNIYFMNPKGFKSDDELEEYEIDDIIYKCEEKGDITESASYVRDQKSISKEVEEVYKNLIKDKEKPILVFDTCIHHGDSLVFLKKTLLDLGFSDLKIGSISPARYQDSKVKPDFYITEQESNCHPFGFERLINKTLKHAYSQPADRKEKPEKIERSIQIRKEIKMIIKDFLKKEG